MAYASITKPSLYFDGKIYLGSASAVTVTGLGFQPDLVWVKDRDNGNNHCWVDAVRGVGKYIESDNNGAQVDNATNSISAFTSDGFTTGTANPANEQASTSLGFMSWNWKANGAGSSNSEGSENTTVSANTTAGFSICTFNNGSGSETFGHGLGVAPSVVIVRNIATCNWAVYHKSLGATKYMVLNSTSAVATGNTFDDTAPTSTVFSLNTAWFGAGLDGIAYCFAEKTGYSKFGSYKGNGNADGTFVYTGFKPAFILLKQTDSTNHWNIYDNKRDVDNAVGKRLNPNISNAETSNTDMDFLSNGFKLRNSGGNQNASGSNYIYMAFGQSLVGSNNVPCTAR